MERSLFLLNEETGDKTEISDERPVILSGRGVTQCVSIFHLLISGSYEQRGYHRMSSVL